MTRDVNDLIGIRYEARNADGDLVSTTVAVTVTKPDGTTDTPAVTPAATGLYDAQFTADAAGKWRWTWNVSGTITDVQSGSVDVGPVVDTYVSLTALREALNINEGDRDALLQTALSAAARAVDEYTGRRPGGFSLAATATARTFEAHRARLAGCRWSLPIDEIGSTAGLVVETGDGTTWTAKTDYRVEPANAIAYGRPICRLSSLSNWGTDLVRVTGRPGWPTTPDQIPLAVHITAARFYRRFNTRTNVPDDGGLVRLVDPDVQQLLKPLTPVLIA